MTIKQAIERLNFMIQQHICYEEVVLEDDNEDAQEELHETEVELEALRIAVRALQNRDIPVHAGRWKINKDYVSECSACGYMPMFDSAQDDFYYSPYCPNCGAAMTQEGVKNETD